MNTAINTTTLVAAAHAFVAASTARNAAYAAYDAADSLSKKNKSRDLLIAATKPAYDAAVLDFDAATVALEKAKVAALNAVETDLLDAAVDSALQRASKRLDVDFHRVAGLVSVASGFRKAIEQSDWTAARNIVIDNATGFGEFDGITVTIQSGYKSAIRKFDVAFTQTFTARDGTIKTRTFSPVTVDAEGFNLTATNLDHGSIAANAFTNAWKAAEVLADVAKVLASAESFAAREQVTAAVDAVLNAAAAAQ